MIDIKTMVKLMFPKIDAKQGLLTKPKAIVNE
jgi:hypothetical protein